MSLKEFDRLAKAQPQLLRRSGELRRDHDRLRFAYRTARFSPEKIVDLRAEGVGEPKKRPGTHASVVVLEVGEEPIAEAGGPGEFVLRQLTLRTNRPDPIPGCRH